MNVIQGELEHGTELIYGENRDMDESAIQKWLTQKKELGVFSPIVESTGPDYRSKDIVKKTYEKFSDLRPDD